MPLAFDAQVLDCEFLTFFERVKQFFRHRHCLWMPVQLQFGNSELQVGDAACALLYMPLRAREVVFAVGHGERYLDALRPAIGISRAPWRLYIDFAWVNPARVVLSKVAWTLAVFVDLHLNLSQLSEPLPCAGDIHEGVPLRTFREGCLAFRLKRKLAKFLGPL